MFVYWRSLSNFFQCLDSPDKSSPHNNVRRYQSTFTFFVVKFIHNQTLVNHSGEQVTSKVWFSSSSKNKWLFFQGYPQEKILHRSNKSGYISIIVFLKKQCPLSCNIKYGTLSHFLCMSFFSASWCSLNKHGFGGRLFNNRREKK